MVNKNDAELLRNHIQQFIALNDEEWSFLATHLSEKIVHKNDFFAELGKTAKLIGFVIEGNLRQFYIRNQEERTTYFYFENHLVSSYFSCITGKPSVLSIQALVDTKMLVFNYEHLQELFKISHIWEKFGRLVAEYLALGLEERMVGLLTLSPEERYEQLLSSNKQKIIQRIPQQYIANYLGITPVSLSRIRNRFLKK